LQENPEIINHAAKIFGNQAVVVNIEAKRWDDWYECYTDCGRIRSSKDVIKWAQEVESRGAGEIFLQCVDTDGRRKGFDMELAKAVIDCVKIPVVVSSGAGKLEDIKELIENTQPSGVAISSLLHYNDFTIKEIKDYLRTNNIMVST
jgi:cyclase